MTRFPSVLWHQEDDSGELERLRGVQKIQRFVEDHVGFYPVKADTDLHRDLRLVRQDFQGLIDAYAQEFNIDMSGYLWYFHVKDHMLCNVGGLIFRPPYTLVEHIPVTPVLLASFLESKTWNLDYPEHHIHEGRKDIWINSFLSLLVSMFLLYKLGLLIMEW